MSLLITSLLTQGLTSTIGTMTTSIYKTLGSIYRHQNPDITLVLKRLDIERKLRLIESLLNLQPHRTIQRNPSGKEEFVIVERPTDPQELCLDSLSEIMAEINQDLTVIKKKADKHEQKYFKNWRTLNLKKELDQLEMDSTILNYRFEDLVKVSSLIRKT